MDVNLDGGGIGILIVGTQLDYLTMWKQTGRRNCKNVGFVDGIC